MNKKCTRRQHLSGTCRSFREVGVIMKQKVVTTVAGIEFDALIEAQETHSATVPQYPLDEGYSVF